MLTEYANDKFFYKVIVVVKIISNILDFKLFS